MKVLAVRFIGAYLDPKKCPRDRPSVVIVGRSNVGKSSLVNRIVGRAIARTSKTPGRTRQLVYFAVDTAKPPSFYLVDLPGYGYARGPEAERKQFAHAARALLADRTRVKAVLLLVDPGVPWQASDLEMLEWLVADDVPFALAFTKADRLKGNALARHHAELARHVALPEDAAVLATSAKENEGIVGVRKWLEAALSAS